MEGHRTRFGENDDLPAMARSGRKEKAGIFTLRALIMREIMRSRDAQCNTGE